MEFTTVEAELIEGKSARRESWPECKKIRHYIESDADFFFDPVGLQGVIIEDCEKKCDCPVGIWIPILGDKEAEDWVILAN